MKASEETQTQIFDRSPDIAQEVEYFSENITSVTSLDDLMSDRKLLKVALGAFNLADEIDKGAYVRKILEEGTTSNEAFAVRLNNSDYLKMAEMFSNEDGVISITTEQAASMVEDYKGLSYEAAVGEVDNSMRLALNFERAMSELANGGHSEAGGWFKAMGSTPLRTVLEGAFNLPTGFDQLDIDRQKDVLADNANRLFGGKSVEVFKDPEVIDAAIRRYLLTEQINAGPSASTPGYAAISILNNGLGSDGIVNLLLSNS